VEIRHKENDMYQYDELDRSIQKDRVAQYKNQTQRHLKGELPENEFLPLRLQNGLYVQRLAPMLRIAVPYGIVSSTQIKRIAKISRDYDKGYVHFTTRQNIQINWPSIEESPKILEELLEVEMHANQTSGNCIRNTTTDQFAGVAADEIADPRPYCELIRQWSTFHPEFAFLPRKFKIAVCASKQDRAAIFFHDIGIEIVKNNDNSIAFKIIVGGGLGRTPVIGSLLKTDVSLDQLLPYLESILRVYNLYGRRDNKYKARIKILVKALGIEKFKELVEEQYALVDQTIPNIQNEIDRLSTFFIDPNYNTSLNATLLDQELEALTDTNKDFKRWVSNNTHAHKNNAYKSVTLSFKNTGYPPGDATDSQLEALADLADRYSFSNLRISHYQNIILPDVSKSDLFSLWKEAQKHNFSGSNIGQLSDMICCPGGDYCALANAKSIPIAESIQRAFTDVDLDNVGELQINISGCMNACGHHHIGHIGILGVDKKGKEFYQISLGGNPSHDNANIAKILGPSFSAEQVPVIIKKIVNHYLTLRTDQERFIDTYKRVGITSFKEAAYEQNN
jgi:sulfite reductase (NADPH) hemoprotein beta-component